MKYWKMVVVLWKMKVIVKGNLCMVLVVKVGGGNVKIGC